MLEPSKGLAIQGASNMGAAHRDKSRGLEGLVLRPYCCVTLGNSLNLSEPQFSCYNTKLLRGPIS